MGPGHQDDPYDLRRFVVAQDDGGTYDTAVAELAAGAKRGHWMWFVLPQVAGLGRSSTARHYALPDLDAARAYLGHPVLGPRLLECARVLAELPGRDPVAVMGPVDSLKLRSCMTLFARAAPEESLFTAVLDRYFGGEQDPGTLDRL